MKKAEIKFWEYVLPFSCVSYIRTLIMVYTELKLKLKLIYDRQSVGHLGRRPSWCRAPIWDPRSIFLFTWNSLYRQLRVCYSVEPSLTRGRVCNLLHNCFWSLPEQSFLGRSPAELTAIFYCLIWDSPNLKGQAPIFISPRNRVEGSTQPRE
jgi:hypothetical protein